MKKAWLGIFLVLLQISPVFSQSVLFLGANPSTRTAGIVPRNIFFRFRPSAGGSLGAGDNIIITPKSAGTNSPGDVFMISSASVSIELIGSGYSNCDATGLTDTSSVLTITLYDVGGTCTLSGLGVATFAVTNSLTPNAADTTIVAFDLQTSVDTVPVSKSAFTIGNLDTRVSLGQSWNAIPNATIEVYSVTADNIADQVAVSLDECGRPSSTMLQSSVLGVSGSVGLDLTLLDGLGVGTLFVCVCDAAAQGTTCNTTNSAHWDNPSTGISTVSELSVSVSIESWRAIDEFEVLMSGIYQNDPTADRVALSKTDCVSGGFSQIENTTSMLLDGSLPVLFNLTDVWGIQDTLYICICDASSVVSGICNLQINSHWANPSGGVARLIKYSPPELLATFVGDGSDPLFYFPDTIRLKFDQNVSLIASSEVIIRSHYHDDSSDVSVSVPLNDLYIISGDVLVIDLINSLDAGIRLLYNQNSTTQTVTVSWEEGSFVDLQGFESLQDSFSFYITENRPPELLDTVPADGAVLDEFPENAVFAFSNDVELNLGFADIVLFDGTSSIIAPASSLQVYGSVVLIDFLDPAFDNLNRTVSLFNYEVTLEAGSLTSEYGVDVQESILTFRYNPAPYVLYADPDQYVTELHKVPKRILVQFSENIFLSANPEIYLTARYLNGTILDGLVPLADIAFSGSQLTVDLDKSSNYLLQSIYNEPSRTQTLTLWWSVDSLEDSLGHFASSDFITLFIEKVSSIDMEMTMNIVPLNITQFELDLLSDLTTAAAFGNGFSMEYYTISGSSTRVEVLIDVIRYPDYGYDVTPSDLYNALFPQFSDPSSVLQTQSTTSALVSTGLFCDGTYVSSTSSCDSASASRSSSTNSSSCNDTLEIILVVLVAVFALTTVLFLICFCKTKNQLKTQPYQVTEQHSVPLQTKRNNFIASTRTGTNNPYTQNQVQKDSLSSRLLATNPFISKDLQDTDQKETDDWPIITSFDIFDNGLNEDIAAKTVYTMKEILDMVKYSHAASPFHVSDLQEALEWFQSMLGQALPGQVKASSQAKKLPGNDFNSEMLRRRTNHDSEYKRILDEFDLDKARILKDKSTSLENLRNRVEERRRQLAELKKRADLKQKEADKARQSYQPGRDGDESKRRAFDATQEAASLLAQYENERRLLELNALEARKQNNHKFEQRLWAARQKRMQQVQALDNRFTDPHNQETVSNIANDIGAQSSLALASYDTDHDIMSMLKNFDAKKAESENANLIAKEDARMKLQERLEARRKALAALQSEKAVLAANALEANKMEANISTSQQLLIAEEELMFEQNIVEEKIARLQEKNDRGENLSQEQVRLLAKSERLLAVGAQLALHKSDNRSKLASRIADRQRRLDANRDQNLALLAKLDGKSLDSEEKQLVNQFITDLTVDTLHEVTWIKAQRNTYDIDSEQKILMDAYDRFAAMNTLQLQEMKQDRLDRLAQRLTARRINPSQSTNDALEEEFTLIKACFAASAETESEAKQKLLNIELELEKTRSALDDPDSQYKLQQLKKAEAELLEKSDLIRLQIEERIFLKNQTVKMSLQERVEERRKRLAVIRQEKMELKREQIQLVEMHRVLEQKKKNVQAREDEITAQVIVSEEEIRQQEADIEKQTLRLQQVQLAAEIAEKELKMKAARGEKLEQDEERLMNQLSALQSESAVRVHETRARRQRSLAARLQDRNNRQNRIREKREALLHQERERQQAEAEAKREKERILREEALLEAEYKRKEEEDRQLRIKEEQEERKRIELREELKRRQARGEALKATELQLLRTFEVNQAQEEARKARNKSNRQAAIQARLQARQEKLDLLNARKAAIEREEYERQQAKLAAAAEEKRLRLEQERLRVEEMERIKAEFQRKEEEKNAAEMARRAIEEAVKKKKTETRAHAHANLMSKLNANKQAEEDEEAAAQADLQSKLAAKKEARRLRMLEKKQRAAHEGKIY